MLFCLSPAPVTRVESAPPVVVWVLIKVWPEPAVTAGVPCAASALMTSELLAEVVIATDGAVLLPIALPVTPTAPEPFVPPVFTPEKAETTIVALAEELKVAVTVPKNARVARARQTSRRTLVLFVVLATDTQVSAVPEFVTEETVWLELFFIETKASNRRFVPLVKSEAEGTVVE